MFNWLNAYRAFVALIIRCESLDLSDASIRTAWNKYGSHGAPPVDSPQLGIG